MTQEAGKGGRILKYLTLAKQRELCRWLGAHGDSYEQYQAWCDLNEVPEDKRYSRNYFRIWKYKPKYREMIKGAKTTYLRSASRYAVTEKKLRVEMLEDQFSDIQADIDEIRSVPFKKRDAKMHDLLLKWEAEKRKTLIEIAREMGEYNTAPDENKRAVPTKDNLVEIGERLREKRASEG